MLELLEYVLRIKLVQYVVQQYLFVSKVTMILVITMHSPPYLSG